MNNKGEGGGSGGVVAVVGVPSRKGGKGGPLESPLLCYEYSAELASYLFDGSNKKCDNGRWQHLMIWRCDANV